MSKPKSIAEDISRVQHGLAAIVTRDLIAGKVTSVRDAPRIVSIGRVIADLDDVAAAVYDLEEIVEDLADTNPVVVDMGYFCANCREAPVRWEDMSLSEHSLYCPWRRAVEWLDDAADSAVADASEVEVSRYAYQVQWSSEDGEYVATVAEFPSLSRLDLDPIKALQGLVDVVAEVVADLGAAGEPIPEPENRGFERGIPDEELVGEDE